MSNLMIHSTLAKFLKHQGAAMRETAINIETVLKEGRKQEEAFKSIIHLIAAMCSPHEYRNNKKYSQRCNLTNSSENKRFFQKMNETLVEDWMSPERYAQVMIIIENNLKIPEDEKEIFTFPCSEGDQRYTACKSNPGRSEGRQAHNTNSTLQGWSDEGLARYLELCKFEAKDRKQYGRQFSENDKHKRCDYLSYPPEPEQANAKKKKKNPDDQITSAQTAFDFDDDDDEDSIGIPAFNDERIAELIKDGEGVEPV